MSQKISFKEIDALLQEKNHDEATLKEIYRVFQKHLSEGYDRYKKHLDKHLTPKPFSFFAKEVIARHKRKMKTSLLSFQSQYYKDEDYLQSLIIETINKCTKEVDLPLRNEKENASISDIETIVSAYLIAMDHYKTDIEERDLLRHLCHKAMRRFASGMTLVSHHYPDEALIVWRSFLEIVTIIKVIYLYPNKNLDKQFYVNKQYVLAVLGLLPTTSEHRDSLIEQAKSHAAKGASQYWELFRFSWVSDLLNKDHSSSKLRELAKLSAYDGHYRFTSVFVHERLIKDSDVKIMSLNDYALQLYWRLFDTELRDILKELFEISREMTPEKEEKDVRAHLKLDREKLDEMTRLMS